ncbi:hypothetical protein CPB85DRAFT_1345344 [Mucidula mucida]|nr:hypothetical protein CPB85DRAFT_1345344 [Mucidula mucida]
MRTGGCAKRNQPLDGEMSIRRGMYVAAAVEIWAFADVVASARVKHTTGSDRLASHSNKEALLPMTDSRCPGASIELIKSRHRLAHEERSYHICYRFLAGAMFLVGHLPASLRFFYYFPLFYCTFSTE